MAGLSVPAVAREAGVSVATVYRHFGSKQGLLDALSPYIIAKAGLLPDELPTTIGQLDRLVRQLFRNTASMDEELRAARASMLGRSLRHQLMPGMQELYREIVRGLAPGLPDDETSRLADAFLILMSSAGFQTVKDYLQLGPDGAAELVSWIIRTLLTGAGTRAQEGKKA